MIIVLALELRMSCALFKEVFKAAVQIPQGLLERYGVHIPEKPKVRLPFQVCQHGRCLHIADLLTGCKTILPHGKPFIVDEPAAANCLID